MITALHQVFGRKYAGVASIPFSNTKLISLPISTRSGNVSVKNLNGTITNYTTAKNKDLIISSDYTNEYAIDYGSTYTGNLDITFYNGLADVYSLILEILQNFTAENNTFNIQDFNSFINQFPNLYSLKISSNTVFASVQKCNIKGNVADVPNSVERIELGNMGALVNPNELYLDVSNFKENSQLKWLNRNMATGGANIATTWQTYGNLAKLPSQLYYFKLDGNAGTFTYSGTKVWASSFDTLDLGNATMSYSDIDNLINDMNNSITTAIGSKVIHINGLYTNTTAYNGLIAKGFIITGLLKSLLKAEIDGITSLLPLVKNGTLTNTTDRKGGNIAIQMGSGYLQTVNNLPASNVWSVSFWMKANLLNTANQNVIAYYQDSNFRCFVSTINYSGVDNQISGIILTSGVAYNNSAKTVGKTIQDGSWKHVVMIFNTNEPAITEVKIYLNGVLQTVTKPQNSDNTFSFSSLKLTLGWSDLAYKGALDDVKIFNRPLTQTEITNLYNE